MKNDKTKKYSWNSILIVFDNCLLFAPVLILLYYAFTNGTGQFSMDNFVLFFTDSKAIRNPDLQRNDCDRNNRCMFIDRISCGIYSCKRRF